MAEREEQRITTDDITTVDVGVGGELVEREDCGDGNLTDAEIRTQIYGPGRVSCRGARHLSLAEREQAAAVREDLMRRGEYEEMRERIIALADGIGHTVPAEALVADDGLGLVFLRLASESKPCGFDLGPLFAMTTAFDGQWHNLGCPGCGTVVKFRPPLSVEQAVVSQATKRAAITRALATPKPTPAV